MKFSSLQLQEIDKVKNLLSHTYRLVMICSFAPNDATAFVCRILFASLLSTPTATSESISSEIDSSMGGASKLLIVDEYSIVTQRIFEYEIADNLASLKIKPINESEHNKMTVVEDWIVVL